MTNEEQIRFQGLSRDPQKSRMVDKALRRKHVSTDSLLLSILNDLFLNSQKLDPCLRNTTNSDVCSLNFAKVGSFTSRSNDVAPLINEAVAKGNNFDSG